MRTIALQELRLAKGSHRDPEQGMCLMEAQSLYDPERGAVVVNGRPMTDQGHTVSPTLAAFGRRWNDALDDDTRQRLIPYVARLHGTSASDEVERRRSYLATDWSARVAIPKWLRACGLESIAEELEALAPVFDEASAAAAKILLRRVNEKAYSLRLEQLSECGLGHPPFTAADKIIWLAASDVVWDAGDAVTEWDAGFTEQDDFEAEVVLAALSAWDTVDDELVQRLRAIDPKGKTVAAIRTEVDAIALPHFKAALREKLGPVVRELQESAFGLLDRMVAVGETT